MRYENLFDSQEEYEECLRPWDARETYKQAKAIAQSIEPNFVMDEQVKKCFEILSLYYSDDQRFEERGYGSLQKGICLTGNPGIGKTLLMRAFSINKKNCFAMENAMKIADDYQVNGFDNFSKFFQNLPQDIYKHKTHFLQRLLGVCFDDLGTEDIPARHFGKDINVFEKIITYRYELKGFFHLTHFTSNLDGKAIEECYGTRIRSRLREMVNFIQVEGPDRRK